MDPAMQAFFKKHNLPMPDEEKPVEAPKPEAQSDNPALDEFFTRHGLQKPGAVTPATSAPAASQTDTTPPAIPAVAPAIAPVRDAAARAGVMPTLPKDSPLKPFEHAQLASGSKSPQSPASTPPRVKRLQETKPSQLAQKIYDQRILPGELDAVEIPWEALNRSAYGVNKAFKPIAELGLKDPVAGKQALLEHLTKRETPLKDVTRSFNQAAMDALTFGLVQPDVTPQTKVGQAAEFAGAVTGQLLPVVGATGPAGLLTSAARVPKMVAPIVKGALIGAGLETGRQATTALVRPDEFNASEALKSIATNALEYAAYMGVYSKLTPRVDALVEKFPRLEKVLGTLPGEVGKGSVVGGTAGIAVGTVKAVIEAFAKEGFDLKAMATSILREAKQESSEEVVEAIAMGIAQRLLGRYGGGLKAPGTRAKPSTQTETTTPTEAPTEAPAESTTDTPNEPAQPRKLSTAERADLTAKADAALQTNNGDAEATMTDLIEHAEVARETGNTEWLATWEPVMEELNRRTTTALNGTYTWNVTGQRVNVVKDDGGDLIEVESPSGRMWVRRESLKQGQTPGDVVKFGGQSYVVLGKDESGKLALGRKGETNAQLWVNPDMVEGTGKTEEIAPEVLAAYQPKPAEGQPDTQPEPQPVSTPAPAVEPPSETPATSQEVAPEPKSRAAFLAELKPSATPGEAETVAQFTSYMSDEEFAAWAKEHYKPTAEPAPAPETAKAEEKPAQTVPARTVDRQAALAEALPELSAEERQSFVDETDAMSDTELVTRIGEVVIRTFDTALNKFGEARAKVKTIVDGGQRINPKKVADQALSMLPEIQRRRIAKGLAESLTGPKALQNLDNALSDAETRLKKAMQSRLAALKKRLGAEAKAPTEAPTEAPTTTPPVGYTLAKKPGTKGKATSIAFTPEEAEAFVAELKAQGKDALALPHPKNAKSRQVWVGPAKKAAQPKVKPVVPPVAAQATSVAPAKPATETPSEPVSPDTPGAPLKNGFYRGPELHRRFRVTSNTGAPPGAMMLETRNDELKTSFGMYVGKDGNMVNSDDVALNRPETVARLWVPANDAQRQEASSILQQMGALSPKDPRYKALKEQLKTLVSGENTSPKPKPPTEDGDTGQPAPLQPKPKGPEMGAKAKAPEVKEKTAASSNQTGMDKETAADTRPLTDQIADAKLALQISRSGLKNQQALMEAKRKNGEPTPTGWAAGETAWLQSIAEQEQKLAELQAGAKATASKPKDQGSVDTKAKAALQKRLDDLLNDVDKSRITRDELSGDLDRTISAVKDASTAKELTSAEEAVTRLEDLFDREVYQTNQRPGTKAVDAGPEGERLFHRAAAMGPVNKGVFEPVALRAMRTTTNAADFKAELYRRLARGLSEAGEVGMPDTIGEARELAADNAKMTAEKRGEPETWNDPTEYLQQIEAASLALYGPGDATETSEPSKDQGSAKPTTPTAEDPYVYHVTTPENLEGILKSGTLSPQGGKGVVPKQGAAHSGGIFYFDSENEIDQQVVSDVLGDRLKGNMAGTQTLRIRRDKAGELSYDEATKTGGAVMGKTAVPVDAIEYFNEETRQWEPLSGMSAETFAADAKRKQLKAIDDELAQTRKWLEDNLQTHKELLAKGNKQGAQNLAESIADNRKQITRLEKQRAKLLPNTQPTRETVTDNTGRSPVLPGKTPAKPTPTKPTETVKKVEEKPAKTAERAAIQPLTTGNKVTAKTERGTAVETQYAVVDADSLTASHDTSLNVNPNYPSELQPRDRTRIASLDQINRIVANLEPSFLGESPKASEGAPIVGPDGVVESGNGRVVALQRIYITSPNSTATGTAVARKSGQTYKAWLVENAVKFGLDKNAIIKAKSPVLVRVRQTEIDRAQFAKEANEQATAAMSATEQAVSDAQKLTGEIMYWFNPTEAGEIVHPGNRDFVRAFLEKVVGPTEQGRYITSDGALSQEGINRIRNAIFARAYGDIGAIEKLAESPDNNVRNITNAMLTAAGRIAAVKDGIEQGRLHNIDLGQEIASAMAKMSALREQGQTVEEYLRPKQMSFLAEDLPALSKDVLAVFDANKRSPKKIATILMNYAEAVEAAGDPRQATLWTKEPPTKAEIWEASVRRTEENPSGIQASLFEGEPGDGRKRTASPDAPAGTGSQEGQSKSPLTKKDATPEERPSSRQDSPDPQNPTYAGARPTLPQNTPPLKPVSRREIVRYMDKAFGPLRVGFLSKVKGALGLFKGREGVIRTKWAEDFPIQAHEIGHKLDQALQLSDPTFDSELLPLGTPTSPPNSTVQYIRGEGVGEFIRLYITDPAKIAHAAPNFAAAFDARMAAEPDFKAKIDGAQMLVKRWTSQDSHDKMDGIISVDEKGNARPVTLETLRAQLVEQLAPLERATKALAGGRKLTVSENPFELAKLARGWAVKAKGFLEHGVMDKDFNKIGESFKAILDDAPDVQAFRRYLVAKRAKELIAKRKLPIDQVLGVGMSEADMNKVLQDLAPQYDALSKRLVKFQDAVLQEFVDSGRISQTEAAEMRKWNADYIPFYRFFDEKTGDFNFAGANHFVNVGNPIKAFKGSARSIIDPLESVVKNTFTMINAATRNEVGRTLLELAEKSNNLGGLVEVVDEAARENTVNVYRGGEKIRLKVDPELHRSLLFLDHEQTALWVKMVGLPARTLRAGAILNPDFVVSNPFVDQFTAFINSEFGYVPFLDLARGLKHAITKDDVYWQWKAAGGAQSTLVSIDRDHLQIELHKLLDSGKLNKGTVLHRMNPLEFLRTLSEYGELGTRLGEFAKGVKADGSREGIQRAALASRDVTLDFAATGSKTKTANVISAFFNASVQGLDKTVRTFKEHPVRTFARATAAYTIPTIMLYLLNRENPNYEEKDEWVKDAFWLVPTDLSNPSQSKHFLWLPKKHALAMTFGALPERMLRALDKKDSKAFDAKFAQRFTTSWLPSMPMPTAIMPVLEASANYSFYTDLPIVPVREKKLDATDQYGPYTSEVAKGAARLSDKVGLGFSPRKADHLIRGFTGGLGTLGVDLASKGLDATGLGDNIPKTSRGAAAYPVARRFLKDAAGPGPGASVDGVYQELAAATKINERIKKAQEKGEAIKLTEEERVKLRNLPALQSAERALGEFIKQKRAVEESVTLSSEAKRAQVNEIDQRMTDRARAVLGKPNM